MPLSGADYYSEKDDDWACDETWTPKERYYELPTPHVKNKSWDKVLDEVVKATKTFLKSPRSTDSFLTKAQAVTVGFDDGDLIRVK